MGGSPFLSCFGHRSFWPNTKTVVVDCSSVFLTLSCSVFARGKSVFRGGSSIYSVEVFNSLLFTGEADKAKQSSS